jgi:hypothetical protein
MSRNLSLFRDRYSSVRSLVDEITAMAINYHSRIGRVSEEARIYLYIQIRKRQRRAKYILRQDPMLINYFTDLKYPLNWLLDRSPDQLSSVVQWGRL